METDNLFIYLFFLRKVILFISISLNAITNLKELSPLDSSSPLQRHSSQLLKHPGGISYCDLLLMKWKYKEWHKNICSF